MKEKLIEFKFEHCLVYNLYILKEHGPVLTCVLKGKGKIIFQCIPQSTSDNYDRSYEHIQLNPKHFQLAT